MAPYRLTTWYDGEKAKVQLVLQGSRYMFYPADVNSIVFVHGNRGGRELIWTKDEVV